MLLPGKTRHGAREIPWGENTGIGLSFIGLVRIGCSGSGALVGVDVLMATGPFTTNL